MWPRGHPTPALRCGGCDLCDTALVKGDHYVALIGNDDSTGCKRLDGPFGPQDHPPSDFRIAINESIGTVCPFRRTCGACQNGPEAIVVHAHCFRLFMRESGEVLGSHAPIRKELLDFIFVRSAWKSPWRDALYMFLDGDPPLPPPVPDLTGLGLPYFGKLPPELVQQVWNHLPRSMLRGSGDIMGLAYRFAASPPSRDLVTVPLSRVSSWKRGTEPVVSRRACHPRTIRLTIDSLGLRSVERLADEALYRQDACRNTFNRLRFAILEDPHPEATLCFMYGIGRLCLPKVHSRIRYPHTWDTPSPPRFVDPLGTHKTFAEFDWTFHTVEMDKITGLTFLHYGGDMAAIHAHTRDEPSASATVERLLPWIKRPTVWEYHPAAAVRECLNNPPPPLRSSYRRLLDHHTAMTIMLRGKPAPRLPTRIIWGYHFPAQDQVCVVATSSESEQGHQDTIQALLKGDSMYIHTYGAGSKMYHSFLSLENVIVAKVYNDDDRYCVGILFEYSDGSTRAVGSCPLGVCQPMTVTMPVFIDICKEPDTRPRDSIYEWLPPFKRYRVDFVGEANWHNHEDEHEDDDEELWEDVNEYGRDGEGWNRHPMDGYVRFSGEVRRDGMIADGIEIVSQQMVDKHEEAIRRYQY